MRFPNMFFIVALVSLSSFFGFGCSSHPVLPQTKDIEVSRDEAGKDCREIGPVTGRVATLTGTTEDALEDMKKEAVKMGANYVKMETLGAQGQSVRGTAYLCP